MSPSFSLKFLLRSISSSSLNYANKFFIGSEEDFGVTLSDSYDNHTVWFSVKDFSI